MTGATPRLENQRRVFRLIDDIVDSLDLDLSGLRVLTEAASGAYVVTALTAARAGAERVHAVTRTSAYGRAADVIDYGREWANAFGVGERIEFTSAPATAFAADTDIVTNLGFVRPIGRALLEQLPRHAAVALMSEPWELRRQDVDVDACAARDIPLIGTNEVDERLRIFDYVGILALKLLLEAEIELFHSRVIVLGSDPFGGAVQAKLESVGAQVQRLRLADLGADLDAACAGLVEAADAIVLAEHRDARELVGAAGGIRPERFAGGSCRLVHIAGHVDDEALEAAGVLKHPHRRVATGYMTLATDYVGPRPVISLHAAGLHVGAQVVRRRMEGRSIADAVAAAEASGLGLAPGRM